MDYYAKIFFCGAPPRTPLGLRPRPQSPSPQVHTLQVGCDHVPITVRSADGIPYSM